VRQLNERSIEKWACKAHAMKRKLCTSRAMRAKRTKLKMKNSKKEPEK
jgi:hypothetical protein